MSAAAEPPFGVATLDETAESAESDVLTASLLSTLRTLDEEADALRVLSEDAAPDAEEEPDWLTQAAEVLDRSSCRQQTEWDEFAAIVQGACAADAESGVSMAKDAGALEWLDAQLVPIVASHFPHLPRLASTPSLSAADDDASYARTLLRARDNLLLRERQSSALAALPVALRCLGIELAREEEAGHALRRGALKQGAGHAALLEQLEITKSAAAAPSAAARTIVDDHDKDVSLLLAALRKAAPDAALAVETKLSASQAQLAARKRHASAEAAEYKAHRKAAAAAQRQEEKQQRGGRGLPEKPAMGPAMAEKVRSFSFGRRQRGGGGDERGAAAGSAAPGAAQQGPPGAGAAAERMLREYSAALCSPSDGGAGVEAGLQAGGAASPLDRFGRAAVTAGSSASAVAAEAAAELASHVDAGLSEVKKVVRALSFNRRSAANQQQQAQQAQQQAQQAHASVGAAAGGRRGTRERPAERACVTDGDWEEL